MSPEQASGDVVDGRSDLYSLGLVAFFAVTGQLAITGDTVHAILTRQFTQPVPPVTTLRRDLPTALAAAIDRLVLKDPTARFPSAESLVETLESASSPARTFRSRSAFLAQDLGQLGLVTIFILLIRPATAARRYEGRAARPGHRPAGGVSGGGAVGAGSPPRSRRRGAWWRQGSRPGEHSWPGFRRLIDEREGERARQRIAVRSVRRRRRFSVRMFWAMIVMAIVLTHTTCCQHRVLVIATDTSGCRGPMVFMLVSSAIMLGIAFIGLMRNPFRATFGEWMFRRGVDGLAPAVPCCGSPGAARAVRQSAPVAAAVQLGRHHHAHASAALTGWRTPGRPRSEDAMRLAGLEARVRRARARNVRRQR
jgi:hypothetical protein